MRELIGLKENSISDKRQLNIQISLTWNYFFRVAAAAAGVYRTLRDRV